MSIPAARTPEFWTRDEVLKVDLLLVKYWESADFGTIQDPTGGQLGTELCEHWSEFDYDNDRLREFHQWTLQNDIGTAIFWNNLRIIMERTVDILYEVLGLTPEDRLSVDSRTDTALLSSYCHFK